MPKHITQNTLFYGDNLPILREHFFDDRHAQVSPWAELQAGGEGQEETREAGGAGDMKLPPI